MTEADEVRKRAKQHIAESKLTQAYYWSNQEVTAFALSERALATKKTLKRACKLVCDAPKYCDGTTHRWLDLSTEACPAAVLRRELAEMEKSERG